ncbi:MAG: LacI family DNA-binding transcriptional regulator [Methylobacteriaceae bacterium]|nr:LacI family DNA-binding transcriptional regulator [Methylobacteriaceae bacterium]
MQRRTEHLPRIRDVAKAAGVSTATVSRALTVPDKLRHDTKARVLDAVRRLGYTPNAAARNLRVGTSKMVLVVIPGRGAPPFFSEVLHGIDTELSADGYTMIMGTLDGSPEKARRVVDLVFARHLDGVLVTSGHVPTIDGRSIADASVPLVSICAEIDAPGVPAVLVDDEACAVAQADHLIGLGHRRLMYVAGPKGNYNEVARCRGFLAAIARAGLARKDVCRHQGDYLFAGGVAAGRRFLAMREQPTGIVCCNDEMAIGFMKTVAQAGVRIPADVSVVGFDGIELADFCEPTLTTIRQPRFDLGATAARLLVDALGRRGAPAPQRIVLAGELIVRDSTAPPPKSA